VDPDSPQRTNVIGVRAGGQSGRTQPVQLGAGTGKIQAVSSQEGRRLACVLPEEAEDHVFVADVPVAELFGLLPGQAHRLPRPGAGVRPLPHPFPLPWARRGGFNWAPSLVTPSRRAIPRHDQPCARALSTCSASSTSTSPRSATTAAIPTSGSGSVAASTNRFPSPNSVPISSN